MLVGVSRHDQVESSGLDPLRVTLLPHPFFTRGVKRQLLQSQGLERAPKDNMSITKRKYNLKYAYANKPLIVCHLRLGFTPPRSWTINPCEIVRESQVATPMRGLYLDDDANHAER